MNNKSIKKSFYILIFLFLFCHFLYGQTNRCGTKSYTDYLLSQNPSALSKMNEIEETISEYGYYLQQNASPLIIPVVVHVVYNTSTQNISDSQIQSQIEVLNKDYRKLNSDASNVPKLFENDVSDCNIEFRLASYDPNGNTTNGITRTQTNVTQFNMYNDYVKISAEGGKDIWDSERYLNIWVCNLGRNPLGYSPYPGIISSELDGVVIDYTCFGTNGTAQTPYDLGRSATHEIGHWLNLIHIWGDDENDADKCSGDDNVFDTPNQEIMNYSCPTFPSSSCSNQSDMFMNYMDYVNDACMYMFTNGQKRRMQSALFVSRYSLRPSISANPSTLSNLSASGGTATFMLTNPNQYNSVNWTIQNIASWITSVSPASGTDNATITVAFAQNNTGEDRAAQLTINTDDEYNSTTTVFLFQNSNQPKYELVLMNVDDNNYFQTDNVGLLRSGVWDMHGTSDPYEINQNQLITAKFSDKYIDSFGKFHRITLGSNTVVSYENYSIELAYALEYRGRFKLSTDCLIEYIFPEIGSASKSLSSGSPNIGFKDPWYEDLETSYGKKNRGLSSIYHYNDFKFDLKRVSGSTEKDDKGVFLEQDPTTQSYYYEIRVPKFQNIVSNNNTSKFYLYGHDFTNSTLTTPSNYVGDYLQSPVIFTNQNPSVKNYYKGTQLSNNPSAYSNNSQRKLVRTPNGYLHMVYESMGYVWYERSTNNGSTWILMNNNKPVGSSYAQYPSIDFYNNNQIVIAYNKNQSKIAVSYFIDGVFQYESIVDASLSNVSDISEPTISLSKNSRIIIVWNSNITPGGLKYRFGYLGTYIGWYNSTSTISNTDVNSIHPTIATTKNYSQPISYWIAWEQNSQYIRLYKLIENNNTIQFTQYHYYSNTGYTYNREPSISVMSDNNYRIAWIGERTGEKKVVTYFNNQYYKFGWYPTSASISATDDGRNIIAYSDSYGSINKFAHIWWYTDYKNLNISGKQIQLCSGSALSNMYAESFQNTSTPYSFSTSNNLNSLSKTSTTKLLSGREAIVSKDSINFYYVLGNVLVDNIPQKPTEIKKDSDLSKIENVNSHLITESFNLKDNSSFTFSVIYGSTDSITAMKNLSKDEFVSFKVELIQSSNDKLLGEYHKIVYNNSNVIGNKTESFKIDPKGIGNREVYLRLVVETNVKGDIAIANIHSEEEQLAKQTTEYVEINYSNQDVISDYSLSQNYPNPFNPTTTIKYAIPSSVNVINQSVKLNVYDILGREVASLVNRKQDPGFYEVSFNAGGFASGIYYSRLSVGSFIQTKKMILIK